MKKLKVKLGKETHELEIRPLTIICKAPEVEDEIEYPEDVQIITSPMTLKHIEKQELPHQQLLSFLFLVFSASEFDVPAFKKNPFAYSRTQGLGFQHVVGMLDMCLKAISSNTEFVLKHPESHLDNTKQANLTDMVVAIIKYKEEREVPQDFSI